MSDDLLRRDVRMLGEMLGGVIADLAGPPALELVESIRLLARERRGGSQQAERDLASAIAGLSVDEACTIARAFSIYFDLANIAEDRQRVRVLRDRERQCDPDPMPESLGAAVADVKGAGLSAGDMRAALGRLSIELVFTAHPSEAKRRSIRAKLRRMRGALQELDRADLLPRERRRFEDRLRAELRVLWQTAFLRPERPTVFEEVERGLSIVPRLWEVVPQVYHALRRALAMEYPGEAFVLPVFLQFGSWMGGDRDGHPQVDAAVTARTLCRLRNAAVDHHVAACRNMFGALTMSSQEPAGADPVRQRVAAAVRRWPEAAGCLRDVAPHETYRQWIRIIEWRLVQSRTDDLAAPIRPGDYGDGAEFVADVQFLCDRVGADHDVQAWLDVVRVFGLHLTSLDIRQDARRYQEVMTELLSAADVVAGFGALDEPRRLAVLAQSLDRAGIARWPNLSPLAADTLDLYRILQQAVARFGPHCLGGSIISLTRSASDVLSVLWLWRWAQADARARGEPVTEHGLRIVPLFEKIADLTRAPHTLSAVLDQPAYAAHLAAQGDHQIVMVGYSDSTKDGGYLAACWALYRAQRQLQQTASRRGVTVTFFHGRGGSLGRGGGPAARGIQSLPNEALDGSLRLTEQGEVLAERYDDVQIAYRHLEQVCGAMLTASNLERPDPKAEWVAIAEALSKRSLEVYRELVDQPGFMPFFAETTPIEDIENLPIGSRPSRRRGERSLDDLRAIPWVFSWTQNRCLIPAWYGLGSALAEVKDEDRGQWQTVCEMYRQWPFFGATIDNAALALAKADMFVARRYADLAESAETRERTWVRIASERDRTRQAILDIVSLPELLAATPWFERSIDVRNPYIDPLNLIQIECMRRRRALTSSATDVEAVDQREAAALRDLLRLTVQGIAAGMRTTG